LPAHAQSAWKPEKNVEIIVPAAAGGGTDRTARVIQRIFQNNRTLPVPAVVNNRPGGGGAIGWTYVAQRSGDAHLLVMTQPALLTNFITGASKLDPKTLTPIAQLSNEYIGFAVRAESGIKSASDLVRRLVKDPQSVVFGVSNALGAPGHIALALVARAINANVKKLKVVVFASGGESQTALLGGHIEVVPSTVANLVAPLQGGKVRVMAVTAPRRLGGVFAQVPTWREQGIDVVVGNWRGIAGAPKLDRAQVAFWEAAFSRMTQNEDWQSDLEKDSAQADFMNGADSGRFLDAQFDELRKILVELELTR
jgi:putative tricarboxylic transport membrane protein